MKNIFVTDGAGFIGSNFVHYLLRAKQCIQLVNLDALMYAGSLENLKDLSQSEWRTFVHGDICDRSLAEELLRKHQIDTIIHFAAETHFEIYIKRS